MVHISKRAPFFESPAYSKVNELYLSCFWVIENVFQLDVSVTNLSAMEVVEGFQELLHDFPELILGLDASFVQGGGLDQLHDQPAHSFASVDVEGLVGGDVRMIQTFEDHEAGTNGRHVFVLEGEGFYGILLVGFDFAAAVDHSA